MVRNSRESLKFGALKTKFRALRLILVGKMNFHESLKFGTLSAKFRALRMILVGKRIFALLLNFQRLTKFGQLSTEYLQ